MRQSWMVDSGDQIVFLQGFDWRSVRLIQELEFVSIQVAAQVPACDSPLQKCKAMLIRDEIIRGKYGIPGVVYMQEISVRYASDVIHILPYGGW